MYCFYGMVDCQKALSFISNQDHCQIFTITISKLPKVRLSHGLLSYDKCHMDSPEAYMSHFYPVTVTFYHLIWTTVRLLPQMESTKSGVNQNTLF